MKILVAESRLVKNTRIVWRLFSVLVVVLVIRGMIIVNDEPDYVNVYVNDEFTQVLRSK